MKAAEVSALAWVRAACESGEARAIRTGAKITLGEVAGHCSVTHSAVSLWERGRRNPSGPPALAYAKLLRSLQKAKAA
jgi:DNA-binding transcriptional regulator YiaG